MCRRDRKREMTEKVEIERRENFADSVYHVYTYACYIRLLYVYTRECQFVSTFPRVCAVGNTFKTRIRFFVLVLAFPALLLLCVSSMCFSMLV